MPCAICGSVAAVGDSPCPSCGYRSSTGQVTAAATATPIPPLAHPASPASSGPLQPGQMFGPRYRILKMLGAGGMGVVYQAWDETLGVAVALKVIRREAFSDPVMAEDVERRFKRELLLARQVTHRNVVRIHDIGEIDGIQYISMPFVEGKNLATLLTESGGKLPVGKAVALIRQIGEGLAVAHEAGVVHRDLKPENIMVDAEGHALIMDFGISRSVTSGATMGLTMTGAVVGTLEYMSPEQAKGIAVDQRADLYALGLMLYDLVAGRTRLQSSTSAMAEMMARLEQPPPTLRSVVPDVSPAIERIVARAVEPDPRKRYQHVGEMLADLVAFESGKTRIRAWGVPLSVLFAAVLVATVLAAGTVWWLVRPRGDPPAREALSVLIADFDNRTGDPLFDASLEQALAIGIEGASFITSYRRDLAHRVAEQIKPGSTLDENTARLVAVREGVKVAIAGSVQPSDDGYSLAVKAIDPTNGDTLFEASAGAQTKADVLKAIGTLASQVRERLGDTTPESARLAATETFTAGSLEAMREYSVAQALSRGRDAEALEHYRAATRFDPNFGRAYAGWAISASRLGRRDEAAEQWKRALQLLDRMTEREKYRTLGGYYLDFAHNYQQAVENYRTLVDLYPADEAGHSNLALSYFFTLNLGRALEHGRRAVAIYPSDPRFRTNLALYAMYASDFPSGAEEAKRVLAQDGRFHKAYLPVAVAALASGDAAAAGQAYDKMAATGTAGASLAAIGRGDLAMYYGRFDQAVEGLRAGIDEDERARNMLGAARKRIALAEAHYLLGRQPEALAAVNEALKGSDQEAVLVPAALLLVDLNRAQLAEQVAETLARRVSEQSRAYTQLIQARIALARGRPVEALDALREGLRGADLWLLHLNLGMAYLQAADAQAAAALAEFELCLKRRGEASAVFLDDVPSFRYLAPVQYWLARARQGVGLSRAARESYDAFLSLRPDPSRDPLAADARVRLTALQ